ncbi:ATP-binding protein [Thermoleptolyngbya sichuanensis XZ-Cy5]|uniref:sensor histidine kinase n=1 Tax=Thermoleptolyngbya sichuanensis TaxID=2885951 RepID=UPI00240D1A31|nr:ATP-binding protein [Thermoleptolyngbya sichuanensis]MDG2618164.1 ATP-binding protein [Thermoleptolyngbya sichuanensis XZ-Cy5]
MAALWVGLLGFENIGQFYKGASLGMGSAASSFIPHGHCYLWQPGLVGLHVGSDVLIALAYYSIPLTLYYFVRKRKDLPFNDIFLLFGAFIVACGTTHLLEVWTLWHPDYWLSGSIKLLTAGISLFTAKELFSIVPNALALPSPTQLEQANQELQAQIAERMAIEAELKCHQAQLEDRVAERTAQLEASNHQMEELLRREQEARSQTEKARTEIQRYANRLTLALDAAEMGFWEWDIDSNRITGTPQFARILGREPSSLENFDVEDWKAQILPEDRALAASVTEAAIAQCQAFRCEYRLKHPDGSLRWVNSVGRCEYDADGQPMQMSGVLIDTTQRRLDEASLRESEETTRRQLAEIEAIYTTAPIGLCVFDTQFRYVRLNDFLAEINGVPIEDHLGKTVWDIVPELAEHQERVLRQVASTGQPVLNLEVQGETPLKPGVLRDWLANYYPLWGLDGNLQGINVTVQEVTERKRDERELEARAQELAQLNLLLAQSTAQVRERNQELDQFAYVVSHDLKAPLRAIANLAYWIEEDLDDSLPEETRQHLTLMQSRVRRMEGLINGLLEYSRIGRSDTTMETVNLTTLLHEVVDLLDPPDTVQVLIPEELPTLTTKPLLLSQVLANLIGNAIKHRDRPDGRVEVTVADQGRHLRFTIADDGPGIDPRYHDRIFAIFQTLKSKDDQESTGIGLSIVKKIIDTEGGEIHLESELGQGTTFWFTWPKGGMA